MTLQRFSLEQWRESGLTSRLDLGATKGELATVREVCAR